MLTAREAPVRCCRWLQFARHWWPVLPASAAAQAARGPPSAQRKGGAHVCAAAAYMYLLMSYNRSREQLQSQGQRTEGEGKGEGEQRAVYSPGSCSQHWS